MRVLVLSQQFPGGSINDAIHRGFFDSAPGEVVWYGPREANTPEQLGLAAAVDRFQPDLVLVNMKKRVKDWLKPAELAALAVPRAMVEVDYCFERSDAWYRECGFDVVFFRHMRDLRHSRLENRRWLPFSVHPDWLCEPKEGEERPAPVAFAGSIYPLRNYPVRNRAISALTAAQLIALPGSTRRGVEYMHWWRGCSIGLTCSCVWEYDNAKHLIIPAAGALLLTDGSEGLSRLFDDPEHYELYRRDCAGLVEQVRALLADPDTLLRRRLAAYRHVAANHVHAVRWQELLDALREAGRGVAA